MQVWDQVVDEGYSLLCLFLSPLICVCVCCLSALLITVKDTETNFNMFGSSLMPGHPVRDGNLFSQPAEAEEGWNEDSKGHQDGKHEAAVVRGIGVGCARA